MIRPEHFEWIAELGERTGTRVEPPIDFALDARFREVIDGWDDE